MLTLTNAKGEVLVIEGKVRAFIVQKPFLAAAIAFVLGLIVRSVL